MAMVSNNDIAHAIYLASKDVKHEEMSLFYKKIVNFLIKRKLLSKAPDILSRLKKIINHAEGKVVARISSKEKIDNTTNKMLAETLARRYSAKEIEMVENLDEKLLGGFKIEVDDEVIDLTIKNKIGKLQEYLIK
ncbi:F0F1 ATP synthase subunit delta [Candidatus Nomurabacteria bacterium]|nr:F0F1 ATP synthase subunit delta [Candidatus Nomurabacteria bacterium]